MKKLLLPFFLFATLLAACGDGKDDKEEPADVDGDGLTDDEEADLGTDPNNSDSDADGAYDGAEIDAGTDPMLADCDGDGLLDGEETTAGTDPWAIDTDGDTYTDKDELTEGKDPLDPESRIYIGYWPYNADKEALGSPEFGGRGAEGDMMPRFQWYDQFGDIVDVYDFAQQGKPIVLDVSGLWCSYCRELAAFLDGQSSIWDGQGYDEIPKMVSSGEIYWVTAIDANARGGQASQDTIETWYEYYPNPAIPVVLDENQEFMTWLNIYGYPTLALFDENMIMTTYNRQNYQEVMNELKRM